MCSTTSRMRLLLDRVDEPIGEVTRCSAVEVVHDRRVDEDDCEKYSNRRKDDQESHEDVHHCHGSTLSLFLFSLHKRTGEMTSSSRILSQPTHGSPVQYFKMKYDVIFFNFCCGPMRRNSSFKFKCLPMFSSLSGSVNVMYPDLDSHIGKTYINTFVSRPEIRSRRYTPGVFIRSPRCTDRSKVC